MKSLKILKKRIKSISNTAKITNALEKVSISKMKKFQNLAAQSISYANDIAIIATLISGLVQTDKSNLDPELLNKYFNENDGDLPVGLIVIAPTRGFCGSMISDMLSKLGKLIQKDVKYAGIGLQRKSWYIMSKFPQINVETVFEKPVESSEFESIRGPFDYAMDNYFSHKYSKVFVYYTEYEGSFNYKPVLKQLLPLKFNDLVQFIDNDEEKKAINEDYLLEPDKNTLFKRIVEKYLRTIYLFSFISSKASEHNARMIAMKNATDNAKQLNNVLNLQYNKSRQESITTELLDIIGGNITK
jgi:F-type H+-transporting ATPase subunit gamma